MLVDGTLLNVDGPLRTWPGYRHYDPKSPDDHISNVRAFCFNKYCVAFRTGIRVDIEDGLGQARMQMLEARTRIKEDLC